MGEVLFDFGSAATNIGNKFTIMKSCEFTFGGVIFRREGQIKRKFLVTACCLLTWKFPVTTIPSLRIAALHIEEYSITNQPKFQEVGQV